MILSADAQKLPTDWISTKRELVTFKEDTTYLLWGKGTDPISVCGWGQVAEARIGGLLVPLDGIAKDARVLLHAVEYVAEDEYGSAFVCEERLTELKVSNAKG